MSDKSASVRRLDIARPPGMDIQLIPHNATSEAAQSSNLHARGAKDETH